MKFISKDYNNLLAKHFGFNIIKKDIGQKYYWLSFKKDVNVYVKGYNICLFSKIIRYKFYNNS